MALFHFQCFCKNSVSVVHYLAYQMQVASLALVNVALGQAEAHGALQEVLQLHSLHKAQNYRKGSGRPGYEIGEYLVF